MRNGEVERRRIVKVNFLAVRADDCIFEARYPSLLLGPFQGRPCYYSAYTVTAPSYPGAIFDRGTAVEGRADSMAFTGLLI